MFASIGRRLALLNAAVVALVIAFVGATTYLLLRESLIGEADHALVERAETAQTTWAALFVAGSPQATEAAAVSTDGDEDEDDEHEDDGHEGEELLEGGDTLAYAFRVPFKTGTGCAGWGEEVRDGQAAAPR
jgi:hypothetical protein